MAEFGHVVAQGAANIRWIRCILEDEASTLPQLARELGFRYLDQIAQINVEVDALKQRIAKISSESHMAQRLQTVPGVGPLSAIAIECFAPDMHCF